MTTHVTGRSTRPVGFMFGAALVVAVSLLGAAVLVNFGRRTDRARAQAEAAMEQLSLLRGIERAAWFDRTALRTAGGADEPAWDRLRALVAGSPDTALVDALHLLREEDERLRASGGEQNSAVLIALEAGLETLEQHAGERLFGVSGTFFDALSSDRRVGFGLIGAGLLGALGMAISLRGAASRYREQNIESLAEIHERRRVEVLAAEREEKLRAILEAEPECVKLLDRSGRVVEMNRAGLDMVEADRLDQIQGHPISDLLVPEYREPFAAMHARVIAGARETLEFEIEGLRGTRRWLATHAVPLHDNRGQVTAHLGVTRDISEYRRATAELQNQLNRNQAILDATFDGFFVADQSATILEVNQGFAEMLGYEPAELVGKRLNELSTSDPGLFAARHEEALRAGRMQVDAVYRTRTGDLVELEFSVTSLRDHFDRRFVSLVRDVTERRRVLRALQDEVSRNQLMLDSMLDGYLLCDEDRRILDVNPAGCVMLGYTRPELLRLGLSDLGVVADDVETAADVLALRGQHRLQTVLTAKDGRQVQLDVSTVRMGIAPNRQYAVFARDLTPLLAVTEALRTSESRLQAVLEVSNDGVWEWDIPTGQVRYSARWIESLGYTPDQVQGDVSFWEQLVHPEDMPRVQQALANHFAGRTPIYRVENRLRTGSGKYRWNLDQGRVVEWDTEGRPLRMVGADTDISDRKAAEEEIRSLNTDLEHRVAERTAALEAAMQELEAFAYSVSHDLRGPLRAIDGFSHVLEEEAGHRLTPADHRLLTRIRAGAATMSLLLDELLILSRVTRADLSPELVDLSSLAADVLADLRLAGSDGKARVDIEPGIRVTADPGLLRIALHNLLDNALKFSGVREHPMIRIGAEQSGSGTAVYVTDNGVGFDPAHKDKLFRPFHRLHSPREFPGTGIGLATVERIVRRHGGRIWAESLPDQGATFHFTLGFPATPALRRPEVEALRSGT